jgi:hypothetical protein
MAASGSAIACGVLVIECSVPVRVTSTQPASHGKTRPPP